MKNLFKLFSIGIALVLCLFTLAACGNGISVDDVKADPLDAVASAYEEYMDAIDSKYGKFFDVFGESESEASSQKLAISMTDVGEAEISMDINANENFAADVKISVSEIDASLKLWGDNENIAFSIPELLGEGKYGFNAVTLMDDVKESPMFNEAFTYEDFEEMLADSFGIPMDKVKETLEKRTDGAEFAKYFDDIKKSLEGITPEIIEESVGDVNCISVEYKLTKDEVKDIIDDFMDTLKAELEDIMPDVDFSDTTDYDDIDDISLKFYIAKKSGAIYKSVMTSGEDKITVDYSADLANPLNITLSGNADDEKVIATLKEEVTAQSVDLCFDVKATDENGERTSGASLNYDVKDKTLEIEVVYDGSAVFATSGTLEVSDEKFAVSLDKIIVNNDDVDVKFSYSINTGAEGNVEDMPEYKDITDMDEDDFNALIEDFVNSEIGSQLYGIMQYGY